MKKLILIVLIFLSIGTFQKVQAQMVPTAKLIPLIETDVVKSVKDKGYSDVSVKVLRIPIETISLPEGPITLNISSNATTLAGREYKKVDIYVNSKYQRSIGVPVEIKVYENVLIANDTISKDTVLTRQNVRLERMNILGMVQNAIEEKMLSKEIIATKMYRPGEVIDRRFSKLKPDVVKNALVTVVFKTDNEMAVTVEGNALLEGNIGDFITVQNKTYKKVYMGKIIGPNKVLVEI